MLLKEASIIIHLLLSKILLNVDYCFLSISTNQVHAFPGEQDNLTLC